jgi:hypothetical protein
VLAISEGKRRKQNLKSYLNGVSREEKRRDRRVEGLIV